MSSFKLHAPARFHEDQNGSVAMMLGLSFMVVSFCAGMGIDMARISSASTRLTNAADAAALTSGRALLEGKLSDTEVQTLGENMFWTGMKAGGFAHVNSAKVAVDRDTGSITVTIDADVPMTVTSLMGIKKVNLPVVSAATFQTKDIEVGMALDITGSMASVPSGGGKSKIDALKGAFEKFANNLMPPNPVAGQKVRIGLAPYSAAVNLGKYAAAASSSRSKDGCVTERKAVYSDASPVIGGYFDVKADGIDDIDATEGKNKGAYSCPAPKLLPLSDDRQALIDEVNSYVPSGWTAGHLGVQWGWNIVAEDWSGTWGGGSAPDSYAKVKQGKLIKAVVLMTDGIFNTAYHNDESAKQAIKLCTAMKDASTKGVMVFAVAFDAPAAAQATLKACASGSDFYASASNDVELEAAFAKFAGKLGELHLSK
jgi:Flp pilus assembly protein TadG